MDLNLLALFVAVAETSSFSGGARKLGIPKSSVSRGVARLEAALGIRLLHRTTRQVSLSTAGTALYGRVAPLLASLRESISELPDLEKEPSGEVRVTAAVDFGVAVLADILAAFAARHPAIRVDARLSNQVVDLVAEGFDLAFRISSRPLKDSTLSARKASPIALQLFASSQYLARRGAPRSPGDLAAHDFISFRGARALRLESAGGAAEVEVRPRLIGDEMSFVREAIRAGAGLGLLPTYLADPGVDRGWLSRVLPRWSIPAGHLWIVLPGARQVPRKVAALREFALLALKARPLGPRSE